MTQRKQYPRESAPRIAPGTVVAWLDATGPQRGRVVQNIPGPQGKAPTLVIRTAAGQQVTKPYRVVWIVRETQ